MKNYIYILIAVFVAVLVSCQKEAQVEEMSVVENGETITFTATIEQNVATKASLSGLNVNWESGDYVGIATDNNATIVAYPVVPAANATQCTITVKAVEGATAYYAIFKGRLGTDSEHPGKDVAANDFSGITFNASTKTFTGLTVDNQQVSEGSFSSHNYYTNGYPLTLAGRSDGNTLVMKPCLALVKVQIHSDCVPSDHYIVSETYNNPTYNVDHDHSYSAVRGFLFSQKGSSTKYSCGDYAVQISDNNTLTVTPNGNNDEERELAGAAKMTADTPYFMGIIPGGDITSFRFRFWGYSNDAGNVSWSPVYVMNLTKSTTVAPGDFFDFGTLNPLGLQQTKNHNDDDTADAAAAFTPSLVMDGIFDDWDPSKNSKLSSDCLASVAGTNGKYQEFKVAYDKMYIYFYSKRNYDTALWTDDGYYYFRFDKDGDSAYETSFYVKPFKKTSSPPFSFNSNPLANDSGFSTMCAGTYDAVEGTIETEIRVLRSDIGLDKNDVVGIQSSGNKSAGNITLPSSITFVN